MVKRPLVFIIIVLTALSITACSGESSSESPNEDNEQNQLTNPNIDNASSDSEPPGMPDEPLELSFFINSGGLQMEQFMDDYGTLIQQKYPHISFNLHTPGEGTTLPELLLTGVEIDLIHAHRANIYDMLMANDLHYDITDLIRKYNYDLDKIEPVVLDEMRTLGDGKIFGLPALSSRLAMFYNLDLFDQFGEDYPQPGLTWDEVHTLARALSRFENDTNYLGFVHIARHYHIMNQLAQGYIDPETTKADFNNGNWQKIFNNFARFYEIDNNPYTPISNAYNVFWGEGRAAMLVSMFVAGGQYILNSDIRWDVVDMPSFADDPGIGSGMLTTYFNVSATSKHKDEAFLVAAFMASEEYQLPKAREGFAPALRSSYFIDDFGKGVPQYADKNMAAIIPAQPADSYIVHPYDSFVDKMLDAAFDRTATGESDVNTILREAEDEANQRLSQEVESLQ